MANDSEWCFRWQLTQYPQPRDFCEGIAISGEFAAAGDILVTIFSKKHRQGTALDAIYGEKTGLPSEKYLVAWVHLILRAINDLALGFQISRVVRHHCQRAVIQNTFHLTHKGYKSFVIRRLFLEKSTKDFSERSNASFPNASVERTAGGLKLHLMFFCNIASWIFSLFQASIDSRSSRSPLVMFVPLSDLISWTWPLLAMNLLSSRRNESISRLCATSMWTARIFRHVKITPYLLIRPLDRRTWKGPKKSTPTAVKGGLSGIKRSSGKSAIICLQGGASRLRQP